MTRAPALAAACALAVAAAAPIAPAETAPAETAYERGARQRTIAGALAALESTGDESLAEIYDHLYEAERSQCRAPLHSLKVACLLEAARRHCDQRDEAQRDDESPRRCHRVADVIVGVRLGERHLLPRDERLAIMRAHDDYRRVLERELTRRHAALVTEMAMTTAAAPPRGTLPTAPLPAAIDRYCRDVAGTRDISWQHCAAAIVWFVATSERSF